jgi:uncharacterized protein YkwD
MRQGELKGKSVLFGVHAACLLAFASGCFSAAPASEQSEQGVRLAEAARCITPDEAERMADQVLQLVNLERAERDLQPVVVNPKLSKVAAEYACRMVNEGFFGHRDPTTDEGPADRAVACKYRFYAVGENLAAGQETPAEVMKVWMESPAHRAIILAPNWTELGVAVRTGGEHSIYWVQEFGDPADF